MHAVRALFESAGLARDISVIFVEATLLWRDASRKTSGTMLGNVCGKLLDRFRHRDASQGGVNELLEMVEKLHIAEQRNSARNYVSMTALVAA
jgi:uncharacterized protein (DUF2336 family)